MKLKSIRESYSRFLTVLSDTGIKLNESQKADLDTFMVALESTMRKQREATVKATKKIVETKLNKQYKKVFESFLGHIQENHNLSGKIQARIQRINESKKIARKVNDYLDVYVESILPEKKIVDYDKLKKLETVFESLKDTLLVNEETVAAKKKALSKKFVSEKKKLETQLAKTQVKLNESMKKTLSLNNKIEQFKALELLESKTKDLPTYEARQIKKRLAEATVEEIEHKFDKVLESVENEIKEADEETETTIEDEVNDIIEKGETKKKAKKAKKAAPADDEEEKEDAEVDESDDEEDLDEDEVRFDENGDVELDESEVIDSDVMKLWINRSLQLS